MECLLIAGAPTLAAPKGRFVRVDANDPTELLCAEHAFDHFLLTSQDKTVYSRHWRDLLLEWQPDVVHVQHVLRLGLDLLSEVRRTCPDAVIVHTLHEFVPICHARGLMLVRGTGERCTGASPWRCHQCFPECSPDSFRLRERFVRAHLENVDLFLAPSRFLLERYAEWGIPRHKLRFQDYGRRLEGRRARGDGDPTAFAFLGQAMVHKGILVLLAAMRLLHDRGRRELRLFVDGANMHFEEAGFADRVHDEIAACDGTVFFRGEYDADELPARLETAGWVVVPSIWWENSPLVIQEAFLHGRPVICSDVGGMAEKVAHLRNGLHFRAGDPADLAAVIERAGTDHELWRELRRNIPSIYPMTAAVEELETLYRAAVARRRGRFTDRPTHEATGADRGARGRWIGDVGAGG